VATKTPTRTPTAARKTAGRPRSFDPDQALDQAMHVFWEKGYEGASMHDLTAAMGIQPASLYKAFGNKQSLFEKALARYLAGPAAFIQGAMSEPTAYAVAERTLRDTANFLTDLHKGQNTRCGCMTIQAAMVVSNESQPIRQELIDLRLRGQQALQQRFERAQSEGDLTQSADPADLARFITAIFQGMTVQAINGATREDLESLAETALRAWPK
jgi:AcrR family transcriptional regulator